MICRLTNVLVVVSVFILCSCQKPPTPKAVADEPAFRKPTATEVFNLRSKCADLGDKIVQLNSVNPPLTYNQTSHYEPKTNRCYVDLFVSNGSVINNDWGNMKWPDYASETVFDGQGREVLASVVHNKGKVTAFIDGGPLDATDDDAYKRIKELMADDRKQ